MQDTFINKQRDIGTAFYTVSNIATFAAMLQSFKRFQWNHDQICQLMNSCSVQMDMKEIKKARFLVRLWYKFGIKFILKATNFTAE